MKFLVIFAIFALASGQGPTVSEDLVRAQAELTIGHEFSELFLVQNRGRLSTYLEEIEEITLNAFMDAYAEIKNIGIATREAMAEYEEPSFCKDNVRARWELQVTRFGQKLSQCLKVTDGYLKEFTQILNDLHDLSRAYSIVIPNSSINVLSGLDVFDSRDNLYNYIMSVYRDLFFRALDAYDEFEEFVGGISLNRTELIETYTECYRTLPVTFATESEQDLESIRMCYSD